MLNYLFTRWRFKKNSPYHLTYLTQLVYRIKMPVGTSFENSAMKASFSLSSLQAAAAETPEKSIKPRQFNSLTKKRKEATLWRRSWGSSASDQKDEFWSALQANYNYIMDNELIDNCQEANGELSLDARTWSSKEFYSQFSELYSWLNSIQEGIYGNETNITDKALRAHYMSQVLKKSYVHKIFNEQASQLLQLHPEIKEEVTWRVTHLNSKWDSITTLLHSTDCGRCDQESCLDIDHEVKCLRKWIKNMENCVQPLNFKTVWSKMELETKALEHQVLHREIENHGKIVSSVVKLSKRTESSCNTINAFRVASGLERRWHLLFLRSLEWQCYIESLVKRGCYRIHNTQVYSDSEFDDEPVSKQPRLSGTYVSKSTFSKDQSSTEENCTEETTYDPDVSNDRETGIMFANENDSLPEELCKSLEFTPSSPGGDSSVFTRSNRKATNLGTFYFKHSDTDSDREKVTTIMAAKVAQGENIGTFCFKHDSESDRGKSNGNLTNTASIEDTSDEEWTYSACNNNDLDNTKTTHAEEEEDISTDTLDSTLKPSIKQIHRLVEKAEELVSPIKRITVDEAPLNKISRVKQWLNMEKPDDSCDASGEDEEKESQVSEDLTESIVTYRAATGFEAHNASYPNLEEVSSTPRNIFRPHRNNLKSRPWSVSCISQLSQSTKRINCNGPSFSISESALHKLPLAPKSLEKTFNDSSNSMNGHNSTSTVDENTPALHEEKLSPIKRRKMKLKKKCRKESNSNLYLSLDNSKVRMGTLVKSGSFSGRSCITLNNDRHTVSDPSNVGLGRYDVLDTTTTSGADSDDEKRCRRIPQFKIGEKTSYIEPKNRDKNVLTCAFPGTEEQSSLSEQAWDSYQEKYLSEAYSEAHDSDAARRLLEFGEDYRNFLDSQSDWSNQSNNFSPPFQRKFLQQSVNIVDSDSDTEDVRQLLKNSRDTLAYTNQIYHNHFNLGLNEYLVANDTKDLEQSCDRHLYCLNLLEKSAEEYKLPKSDRDETTDLILRWQNLKMKMNKMQEYRTLQKELLVLKNDLGNINLPTSMNQLEVGSIEDLSRDIDFYSAELTNIEEYKKKLLKLNIAVHHFVTESKDYHASSLKADVSELYRIWNELFNNASQRLSLLKSHFQSWQLLENRLDQLRGDLKEDQDALNLLDDALKDGGNFPNNLLSSVRDVAKLLSKRKSSITENDLKEFILEGSFSDSGISDEGSEHDLGERERRLAAIRRLIRQLECVMAPDCTARIRMSERLVAAEEELKNLQMKCKTLIARSGVSCAVAPSSEKKVLAAKPDDPDDNPGIFSWLKFKRVVRASLPFQLALVALFCLAYLLQPRCCDNMNNFSMSLSPQLRYVRGPPPV